jgi:23S rRNA-/tRNA-specific pseudouridylate synthase
MCWCLERVHTVEPEEVPLEILYEDSDIIVVSKPSRHDDDSPRGRKKHRHARERALGHTKDLSLLEAH